MDRIAVRRSSRLGELVRPFVIVALLSVAGGAQAERQTVAGLGTLDFPTSTASAPARDAFAEGMLLLHLFEYEQAEAAFQRARAADPDFAMAAWGEAMTATHPVWNQQKVDQGRAALATLGKDAAARAAKAPTAREKAYLATVEILYGEGTKLERDRAFLAAMEKLARDYPSDDEAQLFWSLSLLGVTQGTRDVPNFLRAAEIAKAAFARNPQHPGAAHYWIHGMDDPAHAAGALEAAHALSKIAPTAGHAQHMTAHIFMALGLWDEVVASNEAANAVTVKQLTATGRPPFVCGHYAEWLEYGYFQQGRQREALQLLQACQRDSAKTLAWYRAHPTERLLSFRTPEAFGNRINQTLAMMRAMAIVEGTPAVRARAAAMQLDDTGLGSTQGWGLLGEGLDRVWSGKDASPTVAALAKVQPGTDDDPVIAKYLAVLRDVLNGAVAGQAGRHDEAARTLATAAGNYDAIPFDFGPPVPVKPPHELRGELFLAANDAKAALNEFDLALKTAPRRAQSLLGRARAQAALGDKAVARQAYADLQAIWTRADADLPALAEVRAALR